MGQSLGKSLQGVLGDFFCVLVRAAYSHAVVWTVSKSEVGCLSGCVQSLLQLLGSLKSVELDRAGEPLLVIELLAKTLGKHLVNADVRQEPVILLKKRAFVFEEFELPLKLVEPDDFCNLRNVQVLNLVLKGSLWVLDEHAESGIVLPSCKRMIKRNHGWFRRGS